MVLINVFTFIGILAAAISGALLGVKKKMDFFGIIVLGLSTALGGGIVRDMLIGYNPPVALREPIYTVVGIFAAVLVMFFPKKFSEQKNIILLFDAVGLGVFTAVGADTALRQDVSSLFIAVMIGVITGVGGGVLRDMFAQEIPLIFRKEIYATASIAGAFALAYSRQFYDGMIPLYICFVITVVIRLVAVYFGINEPKEAAPKETLHS